MASFEWYLEKKNYGFSIMKDAELEQARYSFWMLYDHSSFSWFGRRLSTKASKQCRPLPVLLFMVVNSTSLSAALINLTDPGHSRS